MLSIYLFIWGKIFPVSGAAGAPNAAELPVSLHRVGESEKERQTDRFRSLSWPVASHSACKEEMSQLWSAACVKLVAIHSDKGWKNATARPDPESCERRRLTDSCIFTATFTKVREWCENFKQPYTCIFLWCTYMSLTVAEDHSFIE